MTKNSWANTTTDWVSYSFVRHIRSAVTILEVADPNATFGTFENPQLFIGRWNLNHDGRSGTLDIYRLPGDGTPDAPDLRIGTYFGPDGTARRVNGRAPGERQDCRQSHRVLH